MRLVLLLALLSSACGPRPDPNSAASDSDSIVGTVERIDLSPMAYDGDAEIAIRTDGGETVEIRVAARMNLCEAEGLDVIGQLRVGDRLAVVGDEMDDGTIRPCTDSGHSLVRPGYARETHEGAYVSGFETSGFRPCGQPDADWWVRTTDDLDLRYRTLIEEREITPGRGLGPFVLVRVEGELSPEGEYGPLGGWDRELIVHRVIGDVEYLAPGDGEWPTPACSE